MATIKCEIKVIKEVLDLFPKYMPKVGQTYDALLSPSVLKGRTGGKAEFCVINVLDKKIVLKKGEYEIVRNCNG